MRDIASVGERCACRCKFYAKSLWINASKHSQRKALLEQWLKDVNYNDNVNVDYNTMNLKVNNSTMKVKLSDNAATKALVERLKEGTITYNAYDYGGFTLSLDNSTGVASISANQTKSNSIYALNGQKLEEVPAKGMYIEDGVKKVK